MVQEHLAPALEKNTSLKYVNVNRNRLGLPGIRALCDAFCKNTSRATRFFAARAARPPTRLRPCSIRPADAMHASWFASPWFASRGLSHLARASAGSVSCAAGIREGIIPETDIKAIVSRNYRSEVHQLQEIVQRWVLALGLSATQSCFAAGLTPGRSRQV
jgi:hypothetical protein